MQNSDVPPGQIAYASPWVDKPDTGALFRCPQKLTFTSNDFLNLFILAMSSLSVINHEKLNFGQLVHFMFTGE